MKPKLLTLFAGAFALFTAVGSARAAGPLREVSILGGVHVLNTNNSTFTSDPIITIPAAASFAYHFNPILSAVGEVSWLNPIKRDVQLPGGLTASLKAPDMLAYQANMRASLPLPGWSPYVTGGVGAMTLLKSTGPDRLIQVTSPQTAFALNFGGGVAYPLPAGFGFRCDFREFAVMPGANARALTTVDRSNAIWTERGAVGLSYSF